MSVKNGALNRNYVKVGNSFVLNRTNIKVGQMWFFQIEIIEISVESDGLNVNVGQKWNFE